jgi:hypothetical protein
MTDYYTDQSGYGNRRKKRNVVLPIILLIVVVIIIMPFYGNTLRYQVSTSIRMACDYLGTIFQNCALLIFSISILQAFVVRRVKAKWVISGILLLYAGWFLTGGTVSFLGMTILELPVSNPGFH